MTIYTSEHGLSWIPKYLHIFAKWRPHLMESLMVELNIANWFPRESNLWLDNRSWTAWKKAKCVSETTIYLKNNVDFQDCVSIHSDLKSADLWG